MKILFNFFYHLIILILFYLFFYEFRNYSHIQLLFTVIVFKCNKSR